jgi:hypothetical protein
MTDPSSCVGMPMMAAFVPWAALWLPKPIMG